MADPYTTIVSDGYDIRIYRNDMWVTASTLSVPTTKPMPTFKKGDIIRSTTALHDVAQNYSGWTFQTNEHYEVRDANETYNGAWCYKLEVFKSDPYASDKGKIIYIRGQHVTDENFVLVKSSTTSPLIDMNALDKMRQLWMGEDEYLYRKHGFKDSEGNWTEEARAAFMELQMNEQHIKVLLPQVKKIDALEKSEK